MRIWFTLFIVFIIVHIGQAQTAAYEYDKLQRLTKTTYTNGSAISYQYDANGNSILKLCTSIVLMAKVIKTKCRFNPYFKK